jgi:carboxylate-amine ligase
MSRMLPHVPLFLALSASSPFWCSRRTGLKGYRLAAYDELPRSGLPEMFATAEDYNAYIAALVKSGVMEDSSYVWWSIRPSFNFPTLELRAPDCCTRLDDGIAIAALYRCLARHLYLHPFHNADLSAVARGIAVENKWRAQRYGVQGTFVTEAGAIAVGDLLDDLLELTEDSAEALGCVAEAEHCRTIVSRGTSADAQLEVFQAHEKGGSDFALKAVAEWVADTTLRG